MSIEISILIALIGCFVGIGGWFKGRDSKIAADAEWKGTVNAKLDVIVGIKENVEEIEARIAEFDRRIVAVEQSNISILKSLDNLGVSKWKIDL